MKIQNISVESDGYAFCNSVFYSAHDLLTNNYTFSAGINKLHGDIDSGIWAISYLLSMYNFCSKKFTLLEQPKILINGSTVSLDKMAEISCYLDESFPLFSSKKTVRNLVIKGLRKSKLEYSPDEIRDMFKIMDFRFERPISKTGNEKFKAMAAIGFSYGKELFCFPWLSQMRYHAFHNHMPDLLDILANNDKTVILPLGN